jgi:transcriptional regulator with XRE-family HTH domain
MPKERSKPEADARQLPEEMSDMPTRLQEALELRGIKPAELARRTEMTTDRVTRFLKKESWRGVTGATIVLWARALRVRPGWLLTGESPIELSIPISVLADDSPGSDEVIDTIGERLAKRGYVAKVERHKGA